MVVGKIIIYPEQISPRPGQVKRGYPWPIDLVAAGGRLASLFGQTVCWTNMSDPYVHKGIDIQTRAGVEVKACASGCVIAVDRAAATDPLRDLVDISVYHKQSRIIWTYAHLDASSVLTSIGEFVSQGKPLGKVGRFPFEIALGHILPAEVCKVFGKSFHHLHLVTQRVAKKFTEIKL